MRTRVEVATCSLNNLNTANEEKCEKFVRSLAITVVSKSPSLLNLNLRIERKNLLTPPS